jgi:hypothetical protein
MTDRADGRLFGPKSAQTTLDGRNDVELEDCQSMLCFGGAACRPNVQQVVNELQVKEQKASSSN